MVGCSIEEKYSEICRPEICGTTDKMFSGEAERASVSVIIISVSVVSVGGDMVVPQKYGLKESVNTAPVDRRCERNGVGNTVTRTDSHEK
eukprot:IDg17004t1